MAKPKAKPLAQMLVWGGFEVPKPSPPVCTLIPLDFEGNEVRTVSIAGVQWWVLSDIAKVLGYRDAEKAGRLLKEKHKGTPLRGTGDIQDNQILVSEAGLWRLLMRSDKAEAERFQDWLSEEVLPALRRTGSYSLTSSPVQRTARRLRCDHLTAMKRVENKDVNKAVHGQFASEGATPRDYQNWHNGGWEGLTGQDAPGLRKTLGIKGRGTPLDHSALVVITQKSYASALALRISQEKGVPVKGRGELLKRVLHDIASDAQAREGYVIGVRDDPRRGKILDYIPRSIASQG